MAVYAYRCSKGHTTERHSAFEKCGKSCKCEHKGCGRRAYRRVGQVSVHWARGFHRTQEDGMAKVKAHNRSDEVQAAIKRGDLVPESEVGMSRNPDNLDGAIASSDSQTAIAAQYEASGAAAEAEAQAEQKRIDDLEHQYPEG